MFDNNILWLVPVSTAFMPISLYLCCFLLTEDQFTRNVVTTLELH